MAAARITVLCASLFAACVGASFARAQETNDVVIAVQIGNEVRKAAISAWHSWNDSHPCVQVEPDGKTFYVPLIPNSNKERGTINFSQNPFKGPEGHDNAIIHVDFINFGAFKGAAIFQTKVDKHHAPDRNRGGELRDGGETEIGIGYDDHHMVSIRGFYFAARGATTDQILKANPNAYIKVTIKRHPAH